MLGQIWSRKLHKLESKEEIQIILTFSFFLFLFKIILKCITIDLVDFTEPPHGKTNNLQTIGENKGADQLRGNREADVTAKLISA